jgi:hypothetical protein
MLAAALQQTPWQETDSGITASSCTALGASTTEDRRALCVPLHMLTYCFCNPTCAGAVTPSPCSRAASLSWEFARARSMPVGTWGRSAAHTSTKQAGNGVLVMMEGPGPFVGPTMCAHAAPAQTQKLARVRRRWQPCHCLGSATHVSRQVPQLVQYGWDVNRRHLLTGHCTDVLHAGMGNPTSMFTVFDEQRVNFDCSSFCCMHPYVQLQSWVGSCGCIWVFLICALLGLGQHTQLPTFRLFWCAPWSAVVLVCTHGWCADLAVTA